MKGQKKQWQEDSTLFSRKELQDDQDERLAELAEAITDQDDTDNTPLCER